ncbi:MAG: pyridoxal phosphate-dependent aminotransferase [Phycisphaerales bacterium JB043]
MSLSERISSLQPSATLAVTGKAKQMKASGIDVLSFAAGEPDFVTPQRIIDAAKRALDYGRTGYAPVPGVPEAREAIAWKLREENEIVGVTPEHVMVSVGGKGGLYCLFQSLFDEVQDDSRRGELLLPVPAWVSYAPVAQLAGGRVVEIETDGANDFKMTPEQLRDAITPNSRALVLNSPSNPCGTMYTPDDLRALAEVVREHPDLIVISDEIYEKIIYGGINHLSIGSLESIADRVITVGGMSKAYAMTGWRLGYVAASGDRGLELVRACCRLQSQMATGPATFCQLAIPTALHECGDDVERMRQAFAQRAELIYERLCAIEGVTCPRPTGAFYAFPDVSSFFGAVSAGGRVIESALDFASALLEEHHVAAVPGEAFGGVGRNCVRFSFACSDEDITRGMERLGAFVAGLRQDSPV